MKRMREESGIEVLDMAKCLMLLSNGFNYTKSTYKCSRNDDVVFECKTCNKQFSSFQALGGHRASHRKSRTVLLMGEDPQNDNKIASNNLIINQEIKAKTHKCSICGLVFPVGQALGGHMRKHRDVVFSNSVPRVFSKAPLLKVSDNSLELLRLDLNLTPLENDLKLLFGKMSPKIGPIVS